MTSNVHVLGIRHHGPGSARSVLASLEALQPDAVLVEGPPDAAAVLGRAADVDMQPPVALLVYEPGSAGVASTYPMTSFSPEWQAIRWALARSVHVAFMDLPLAHRFALDPDEEPTAVDDVVDPTLDDAPTDPIAVLAGVAGYEDSELWWEQLVETRKDPTDVFEAVLTAMTAVREDAPAPRPVELLREAWMRKVIRATQKAGYERIAVVCGAWHAPALVQMPTAKADNALLKGLPHVKTAATWIPWTYRHLATRSGYRAGVESPGWYQHLWEHPEEAVMRWTTRAARLLRTNDLDASAASVIEAVRLAEALGALRDLASPGLHEVRDAVLTVLCQSAPAPMALIRDELEVGHVMGQVPPDVDTVPLQRDFDDTLRRLRMKVTSEVRPIHLDLRKPTDVEKSQLLHRLQCVGVPWGRLVGGPRSTGTFRESWELRWEPALHVALIEANVYGNTLPAAASQMLLLRTRDAGLGELTTLLDVAVLADLPDAIDSLLQVVQHRSAACSDVGQMLDALGPLARILRYGDVRGTSAANVRPIVEGLLERALIGLPVGASQVDDDAARALVAAINRANAAVMLLEQADRRDAWIQALDVLLRRDAAHPFVRGRACRLLVELGALDATELGRQTSLALSAIHPLHAAAWLEGLLSGSGLVLVHQDAVWTALDRWVASLTDDAFVAVVPLLRRGFADFSGPERRQMGEKVRHLGTAGTGAVRVDHALELDHDRAARVLPVLRRILFRSQGSQHDR